MVDGIGGNYRDRLMQKLASGGDVGLAVGVGEQSIVADAMKARGQQMQQEAAHELVSHQRHRFVAGTTVGSVVLPVESHAAIITRDEPAVGDRHPMGIARQIAVGGFGHTVGYERPHRELHTPLSSSRDALRVHRRSGS
jgi:hypothetical protein